MANTIISGSDLGLFIQSGATSGITNTLTIACATDHKLDLKHSLRKVSSKDSGNWSDSLGGTLEWSITSDSLVTFDATAFSYHKIYALMIARTPLTICSSIYTGTTRTIGTIAYVGQAYITSLSLTAKNDETSTMSISLEGTGELKATTI